MNVSNTGNYTYTAEDLKRIQDEVLSLRAENEALKCEIENAFQQGYTFCRNYGFVFQEDLDSVSKSYSERVVNSKLTTDAENQADKGEVWQQSIKN